MGRVEDLLSEDFLPRHLQTDAPPIAICDGCHRKTWSEDSLIEPCGMRQPDGRRCEGIFQPIPPT